MCKFETVSIPTDLRGNMNLDKFKQSLNSDIALIMLTNPNTLGLFEEDVVQISELAHENGTLMYCDGANMNAFLGITRPKDQGFDMIHLNLHKTFSTPHGGGGPGAGVLGVKSFLADYLPVPRVRRRSTGSNTTTHHKSTFRDIEKILLWRIIIIITIIIIVIFLISQNENQ